MLQQLIHSARVNVFESARFYYGVLIVLTFHLIARHSLIKILIVTGEEEWFASKVITALLYGFVYGCCVVSAIFLKKQISKLFLYTWLIISCISVFNEFVFYLDDPKTYDFISSIFSGHGFMNIRITFPILFLGVWQATIDHPRFSSGLFLDLIFSLTLLNSAFVCLGVIFDISVFEQIQGCLVQYFERKLKNKSCLDQAIICKNYCPNRNEHGYFFCFAKLYSLLTNA